MKQDIAKTALLSDDTTCICHVVPLKQIRVRFKILFLASGTTKEWDITS